MRVPLDAACKEHDIAYSQNRENVEARNAADRILAGKAWQQVWSKDSCLNEKFAAYATTNAMKIKSKLVMGLKKKKELCMGVKKPEIMLSKIVKAASKSTENNSREVVRSALKKAHDTVEKAGWKSNVRVLRILPVPENMGGFLPFLIPLFDGLSATGALAGVATGIAKAVNNASAAKNHLEESQRHNKPMEAIALGKSLYLKPHKKGFGLHLEKKSQSAETGSNGR